MVSFYVERIDLAPKLRKFVPKWQWNRPFSSKKSPHKFSNTDPSNLIISKLTHFKQTFPLQNQKTTYSTTLKTFFTVFQISPYFEGTTSNATILNRRIYNKKINRQNIFLLRVIAVLIRKITNFANFPTYNNYNF